MFKVRRSEHEKLSIRRIGLRKLCNENRKRINEINGVKQANVNFAVGKLTIDADQDKIGEIETETRKVIKELEPEVEVKEMEEVTSTLNEEKKRI